MEGHSEENEGPFSVPIEVFWNLISVVVTQLFHLCKNSSSKLGSVHVTLRKRYLNKALGETPKLPEPRVSQGDSGTPRF